MHGDLDAFCRQRRSLFYPKADRPLPDAVLRGLRSTSEGGGLAVAADACRAAFGTAPLSVAPLGEQGTFHLLYRAVLADGSRVVVRLNALGDHGPDYLLHLDAWAADRLTQAGLPALRVSHVDVSRSRVPFDFEILEEARGRPFKAFDDDEEALMPLLCALGRFVGRLHGIRTHGFGFFDIRPLVERKDPSRVWGVCPTWRHYVLCRLEAHVERCAQIGAVSRGEARRVFAAFAAADDLLDDVAPCLVHGDLGSHNVFVEDGTVTALIDWEDCLSGDPVFDVAFWATFHPDRRHRAFLDGYRLERALPDDFERRFWLYYLRVALSKTVLRHRLGLVDLPGREPAARRIQKGLERFEAAARSRPLAA